MHFPYELESQEEGGEEEVEAAAAAAAEEECAAAAAAAAALGHAHPANQNEEPAAVVTLSEPLPWVRSLFDGGR